MSQRRYPTAERAVTEPQVIFKSVPQDTTTVVRGTLDDMPEFSTEHELTVAPGQQFRVVARRDVLHETSDGFARRIEIDVEFLTDAQVEDLAGRGLV